MQLSSRLGENPTAALAHLGGSGEAVIAHSREDDQQQARSPDAGGVLDREVGPRSQTADLRLLGERRVAVLGQPQVLAAGRQQCRAGVELLAAGWPRETFSFELRSRRAASEPVKPAGMC